MRKREEVQEVLCQSGSLTELMSVLNQIWKSVFLFPVVDTTGYTLAPLRG